MGKNRVSILTLLSLSSLLAITSGCEQWFVSNHFSPHRFQTRQYILVHRLKPWCLTGEAAYLGKYALIDINLDSYCACIVGKIDQHFELDIFDPTADRRRVPFFTVKLQSFRNRCLEEIK